MHFKSNGFCLRGQCAQTILFQSCSYKIQQVTSVAQTQKEFNEDHNKNARTGPWLAYLVSPVSKNVETIFTKYYEELRLLKASLIQRFYECIPEQMSTPSHAKILHHSVLEIFEWLLIFRAIQIERAKNQLAPIDKT